MCRLRELSPPDGFVCTGDASALAVAGITDAGRTIGRDAGGRQGDPRPSSARSALSISLPEDTALAGQQMAELLRRIQGEPAENLQVLTA